jgi:hypothetical protein
MLVAVTRIVERQELIVVIFSKTKRTQQYILPRTFKITSDSQVRKEQSAIRLIGALLRLRDRSGDKRSRLLSLVPKQPGARMDKSCKAFNSRRENSRYV